MIPDAEIQLREMAMRQAQANMKRLDKAPENEFEWLHQESERLLLHWKD